MKTTILIDYKELRKINVESARKTVLEYLRSSKANIAETSRVFGIQRKTVYKILEKYSKLSTPSNLSTGIPQNHLK